MANYIVFSNSKLQLLKGLFLTDLFKVYSYILTHKHTVLFSIIKANKMTTRLKLVKKLYC